MRPARRTTLKIGPYRVLAQILPRRYAPHVGADSPRYLEPGRPPVLESFRVFRGREEVTEELGDAERADIRRRICEAAGVPGEAEALAPRPVPHVRERGQGYIDWRK